MKRDLAPKFLYYYVLIGACLCTVFLSVIHLAAMNYAIRTSDFIPFFITSVFGTIGLLLPMLIINKFRYIVINPFDENKFIGNLLSNSHLSIIELEVIKKVWTNTFKVRIEGKVYFITSFDQTVQEFTARQPKHNT